MAAGGGKLMASLRVENYPSFPQKSRKICRAKRQILFRFFIIRDEITICACPERGCN